MITEEGEPETELEIKVTKFSMQHKKKDKRKDKT